MVIPGKVRNFNLYGSLTPRARAPLLTQDHNAAAINIMTTISNASDREEFLANEGVTSHAGVEMLPTIGQQGTFTSTVLKAVDRCCGTRTAVFRPHATCVCLFHL